jgi:hypothetical protein
VEPSLAAEVKQLSLGAGHVLQAEGVLAIKAQLQSELFAPAGAGSSHG